MTRTVISSLRQINPLPSGQSVLSSARPQCPALIPLKSIYLHAGTLERARRLKPTLNLNLDLRAGLPVTTFPHPMQKLSATESGDSFASTKTIPPRRSVNINMGFNDGFLIVDTSY